MLRRRRREPRSDEPRWLIDQRDKSVAALASRVHQGLLQEFEPEEREQAHGRIVYADSAMTAEGYAALSQERIHLALLDSSKPRQPAHDLVPVPYRLVHHYSIAFPSSSVVGVRNPRIVSLLVHDPTNPDDDTDMTIYVGEQGRELITELLDLVDKSRR